MGGGGGALTFNSALTGASNSLVVNGSGSTGSVALGGTGNTYGGGTTVVKGTLRVSPNNTILGSGPVNLGSGSTLALLPYSAPVAATGWNYDVIAGLGESSAQNGVTASFGDTGFTIYQHGLPGSQQSAGNLGLPASRSMVSFANSDTVFQLQPYNQNNALKLGIGTNSQNAQSYAPQGTLTLKAPGQYQSLSVLAATPFGNTFYEVQLNFADGTSVLAPNTAGNLPNYFVGDWTGAPAFNVNTANYQLAFMGAGNITIQPNNGTFQQQAPGGLNNALAVPHPILYEDDVQIPAALQSKTLTSVTFINTGAFNGATNGTDYLHATSQLNIMGLSGTLVGGAQAHRASPTL